MNHSEVIMSKDNTVTSYEYTASATKESFLYFEMKITAQLLCSNLTADEVVKKIVSENLFQYPTEKSLKRIANACIKRLHCMNDISLINKIANESSDVSKQICLYAMMKQYRLIWDFMTTIIGEKYRQNDLSFGRIDLNVFFMRLSEQNDSVASWSDSTITKLKQVIIKTLVENEYLDSIKSDRLNHIWISPVLENAIRSNNDEQALAAFNCFS